MLYCRGSGVGCNRLPTIRHQLLVCRRLGEGASAIDQFSGFSLVIALVMVALMAVISVGVFTVVSLERVTATSYTTRYQAELAVQNGLQAAAKTLAATPTGTSSITGSDTFLVVRADGPADANGNKSAYYYLAKPSTAPAPPSIAYYPLFSSSADPNAAVVQTQPINLAASFAPAVPAPAPPADSTTPTPTPSPASSPCPTCNPAWNAAKTQRLPTLYPWSQPTPSPSGPSVQWVEMHNPQDPSGPYTRYAYWAEDLDGYLDASQVNDPLEVNARAGLSPSPSPSPYTVGTNPGEIAMFTIFNQAQQLPSPAPAPVANLVSNRALLFTVPTLQQIAQQTGAPADVTGANLAVRLGVDSAEQNLVPFGYGYGSEGLAKQPLNPISQFRGKNGAKKFATPISNAMPNFANRTTSTSGGKGHAGTVNYLNNLASNLIDYVAPLDAPTDFKADVTKPPSSRGIGAYPFVVSVYDLNNWVYTYLSGSTYKVVVEVTTYIQLWNPHNIAVRGALLIHYQNSDQVNVNGNLYPLSSPPDASVILTDKPTSDPNKPTFISPLSATGSVGQAFTYFIEAANGAPYLTLQPNEYRVIALPAPGSTLFPITDYGASGLPPWLSRPPNGKNFNRISGTPPAGSAGTYSVTISATNSAGTTSATLVITINP